ncbi:hypothetical protein, partial [Stenotrophomonas maltophilia]|uniref:hypothetical protein n=1 Tax=Stenotrophomonas maltophilia TaxID=40324 RepID=UPI001953F7B4
HEAPELRNDRHDQPSNLFPRQMDFTFPGTKAYLRGCPISAKAINCFLFATWLDQIYRRAGR